MKAVCGDAFQLEFGERKCGRPACARTNEPRRNREKVLGFLEVRQEGLVKSTLRAGLERQRLAASRLIINPISEALRQNSAYRGRHRPPQLNFMWLFGGSLLQKVHRFFPCGHNK